MPTWSLIHPTDSKEATDVSGDDRDRPGNKASHTATAIEPVREGVGQDQVKANAGQLARLLEWAVGVAGAGLGDRRTRPAWGCCWPSSCYGPVSRCWTWPRSWRPRLGCCRMKPPTERSQRFPVGGGGRAAVGQGPPRGRRGLLGGDGNVVRPLPQEVRTTHLLRLLACSPGRTGPGRTSGATRDGGGPKTDPGAGKPGSTWT